MGALKLQFTATDVPLGPVAVNPWDALRATTAELGETTTLGIGVGVAVATDAVEWPPQPVTAASKAHAQTAFSKFMAGEIGCAGSHRRLDGKTILDLIFRDTHASRLRMADEEAARRARTTCT
jgi:hypothetical protein